MQISWGRPCVYLLLQHDGSVTSRLYCTENFTLELYIFSLQAALQKNLSQPHPLHPVSRSLPQNVLHAALKVSMHRMPKRQVSSRAIPAFQRWSKRRADGLQRLLRSEHVFLGACWLLTHVTRLENIKLLVWTINCTQGTVMMNSQHQMLLPLWQQHSFRSIGLAPHSSIAYDCCQHIRFSCFGAYKHPKCCWSRTNIHEISNVNIWLGFPPMIHIVYSEYMPLMNNSKISWNTFR